MTQTTDQERAEYLSWISANYADIYSAEEAKMMWDHGHLSALAWKEQAARRAPAVLQPTVDQVEEAVGMEATAWDCIAPQTIIDAVIRLAANGAPVVPQGYESGVMTGNRVTLVFGTQANAEAWFEQFCDSYDAAAPQPPEADMGIPITQTNQQVAEAAPVQLPEPDAWRYTDANGNYRYRGRRKGFAAEYQILKPDPLYTEHQVRQLLAQKEIK